MEDKYAELEKRVKILEEMLKGFLQSEGTEVHIQLDHCQGDLIVGDNCDISLSQCPIGAMISSNMEDSEALLDEIEDRIDELDGEVDQLENRIDDAENRAEQLKLSLD